MAVAALDTHQDRLRETQRRRLETLELQAAAYGLQTPPHVATEIEELRRQLGEAAADIEPISDDNRYAALFRATLLLSSEVVDLRRRVDRLFWLLPTMLLVYLIVSQLLEHL